MITLLKAQYSGIFASSTVEGEIIFSNHSPSDAANALYFALTGKDLRKRRGDYEFGSIADGRYHLNLYTVQNGEREKLASVTIYKPERATFDMTTEEGRNAWQAAYIAALGAEPPAVEPPPAPAASVEPIDPPDDIADLLRDVADLETRFDTATVIAAARRAAKLVKPEAAAPFAAGVRLPYRVVLYWNGSLCLDGRMTAATAYETIQRHVLANFIWTKSPDLPTLDTILAMATGESLSATIDDTTAGKASTGRASYLITRRA